MIKLCAASRPVVDFSCRDEDAHSLLKHFNLYLYCDLRVAWVKGGGVGEFRYFTVMKGEP